MKKPTTNEVLVSYQRDFKKWYPAEIQDILSSQFTCEFTVDGDSKYGWYFYRDHNITWKDKL